MHRVELNYRGLPYRTVYLEFPDIESVCKQIGAPPTSKKGDGSDHYTLPVIYDSATNRTISDSYNISEYLEETYPTTPRLFPVGATSPRGLSVKASLLLFDYFFMQNVFMPVLPIAIAQCNKVLNPRSQDYFRYHREIWLGDRLEDLAPKGSKKRAERWKQVRAGLDNLAHFMDQAGGEYFLGNEFSRAEIILIAFLSSIKVHVPVTEWEKNIAKANGGRWDRLLEKTRALQAVKD